MFFTWNRLSTNRTSPHPVSVPIFHPRDKLCGRKLLLIQDKHTHHKHQGTAVRGFGHAITTNAKDTKADYKHGSAADTVQGNKEYKKQKQKL